MKIKKMMTAFTLAAAVSFLPVNIPTAQAAVKPAFAINEIKLQGVGSINKYALKIVNTEKYSNFSFVWTSSNPKVVKVAKAAGQGDSSKGYYCNLVPKTKGTAEITCVVSYVTKKNVQKKKTLKASVEVAVPSDRSEDNHIVNKSINNETTQEQYIYQGDTYTFEGAISPIGSSDSIYWKSTDESVFTVDAGGEVKAVGEGAAVLEMYVGSSEESAFARDALDTIKIRTIARPSVKSIQLKDDANTLVINFTHPVAKSTVVSGSALSGNISILPAQYDGRQGKDLGKISAVLNEKTLIVMTENEFSGAYQFVITGAVTTEDGVALAPYDEMKKVVVSLE